MVSEGARQLYDYMVGQCAIGTNGLSVFASFEGDGEFGQTYGPYLEELRSVRWLQFHDTNPSICVLGRGEVRFFREQDKEEPKPQDEYQTRYNLAEWEVINQALRSFGLRKKSGELTERQTLAELKYYSKFPADVVTEGLRKYLNLPAERQFGPPYVRAIIRGDAALTTQLPEATPPPNITPASAHEREKAKQAWVREGLPSNLGPSQLSMRMSQLEAEYDQLFPG